MSECDERSKVEELLGRRPAAPFTVVVRSGSGEPVVIRNAPFLYDGSPMPTLYWLVGRSECAAVAALEAAGGVDEAEASVDSLALAQAHQAYAAERDSQIGEERRGPRPSGGVGGTARGVKCLHAHLAYWLAGGEDPVGEWTAGRLGLERSMYRR